MDSITLNFIKEIQDSVQVGDVAYYTNDVNGENIVKIGYITSLTSDSITCDIDSSTPRPNYTSFVLFAKNNAANTNALKGYYLQTKFVNKSTDRIELFSVGTEVFESSN